MARQPRAADCMARPDRSLAHHPLSAEDGTDA
jgi:hypothetical protein